MTIYCGKYLCKANVVCVVSPKFLYFVDLIWGFPKVGHGTPLQYSCLENPTDGGAW